MKWNASALAPLFLLLAGCMGGSGGYSNAGLEPAGGQGSLAAQTWDGGEGRPQRPPQQDAYQAPQQDQYSQQPQYQPQATAGGAPGAGYERPGSDDDRPAQPRQDYQPRPQQQTYQPPQQDSYADPAASAAGPAGTSRPGAPQRHDEVGYAGVRGVAGGDNGSVVAVHRNLPAGSFVEVTSLETGKTIIALVTATGSENLADLSPAAARMLGATGASIPVRVRAINPTGPDQAALRSGQPAMERPDTPPVLLNALRKQLPAANGPRFADTPQPSYGRPASQPARATPSAAPGRAGFYVQVGAFSNQANANGLAQSLGGFVRPGGGLFRVQMGPYRSAGEAQAARAEAARQGYGDARVFTQN